MNFADGLKGLLIVLISQVLLSCSSEKEYLITFKTEYGEIKAVLYDQTPKHKFNFIKHARAGRYDSTTFHRVINDFMIQGGNINAKNKSHQTLSKGLTKDKKDSTFIRPDLDIESREVPEDERVIDYTIPAEFHDSLIHRRGAIAAPRLPNQQNPEKASSGSQFYIVDGRKFTENELERIVDNQNFQILQRKFRELLEKEEYDNLEEQIMKMQKEGNYDAIQQKVEDSKYIIEKEFGDIKMRELSGKAIDIYTSEGGAPHLDGEYTVFGQVVEGISVVDSIAEVKTKSNDKPIEPVYMTVEVEETTVKDIEKKYDFEFPEFKTKE